MEIPVRSTRGSNTKMKKRRIYELCIYDFHRSISNEVIVTTDLEPEDGIPEFKSRIIKPLMIKNECLDSAMNADL